MNPTTMETWVRRLTPPAHREEVMGDLAERCHTPQEYWREAVRTLPFVIASRIRRTTHPLVVLISVAAMDRHPCTARRLSRADHRRPGAYRGDGLRVCGAGRAGFAGNAALAGAAAGTGSEGVVVRIRRIDQLAQVSENVDSAPA
jgi:hypothetical protein